MNQKKQSLRIQNRRRRVRTSRSVLPPKTIFAVVGVVALSLFGVLFFIKSLEGFKFSSSSLLPETKEITDGKEIETVALFGAEGDLLEKLIIARVITEDKEEGALRIAVVDGQALLSEGAEKPVTMAGLYREQGTGGVTARLQDQLAITIDCVAVTGQEDLVRLVDALGGVRINLPRAIHFDDNLQGIHVHLPAGQHVFDGEKVMELLINPEADPANVEQMVARAILIRALEKKRMDHALLPIITAVLDSVRTDVPAESWLEWITRLDEVSQARVALADLSGTSDDAPFPMEFVSLSRFLSGQEEKNLSTAASAAELPSREEIAQNQPALTDSAGPIRVRILNGNGVSGLAAKLAQKLESQANVKVVETTNADHFNYTQSLVVASRQRSAEAERVKGLMGTGVVRDQNPLIKDDIDMLVILGQDFARTQR